MSAPKLSSNYTLAQELKYGCNPHQQPAAVYFRSTAGDDDASKETSAFTVLNGRPGYINLLDALHAWQLVRELRQATQLPAATSFKHVSPAGAAVAVPLDGTLREVYEVGEEVELTPLAVAYLRARQADPKSSFGDFAAVSDVVDEATARVLKREVSDGIIAPGYEPAALELLKTKKSGRFIVLQGNVDYTPPEVEVREVFGVALAQRRNDVVFTPEEHLQKVVTQASELSEEAKRDLTVASIAVKYTQSNSVAFALNGQVIGVGAGQQSRVDCVQLAGAKAKTWFLRQHPKVRALKFRDGLKRVQRVNARIQYIQGDLTESERVAWEALLEEPAPEFTSAEKAEFLATLTGVSVSSDAFFPFRDNIDQASKVGVSYIAQPGGSVQDEVVIAACDEYGMTMAFTGLRLFHH